MPRRGITPKRHGDGWRVRWRFPGETRQQSITWESYQHARSLCIEIERRGYAVRATDADVVDRSIVTGVRSTPAPESVRTFAVAAEEYIRSRGKANGRTKNRYRSYVRLHCGALNDLPVGEITERHVSAWTNSLYDGATNRCTRAHSPRNAPKTCRCGVGLSRKMVYTVYHFARGVFSRELRLGEVRAHPFAKDESLQSARRVERERFIDLPTWLRLREFFAGADRDFVDTLAATGARFGEIAALQPRDLVTVNGVPAVSIRRTWTFTESGVAVLADPKAESFRTVTVDADVMAMLEARAEGLALDADLFRGPRGGMWRYSTFHDGAWRRAMVAAVAAGVLRERFTPHNIRHSHGSWLLHDGWPMMTVSRRLGHKSIQTTVDIYGHEDPSSSGHVSERLGQLLGGRLRVVA